MVFSAWESERVIVGTGNTAAYAAFVALQLVSVELALPDQAMAREPSTGCKVGPLKSTNELDDRVAACTIVIDSGKSPAQVALALSYRAQSLLDQKK